MASISCQHIYKIYPGATAPSVTDFNLEIQDKEFIIFVGPSGCGKSTTLRMIAGLEEISKGEMYIGGRLINDVPPKDRDIAMVFQSYALYPHMTVYKNIAFGLELRKTPKDEIDKRVHEAARILEIEHLLDRKPKALSGGQRQRIGIARALTVQPKLIIADEPVSALDVSIQAQVLNLLQQLQKDFNLTYLFISHDLSVVEMISDRIGVMYLGTIVETAPKKELYANPRHPYTRALLSAVPIPDPEVKKERITLKGDLPSPSNPPSGCLFHTRCPHCTEKCKTQVPTPVEIAPGHIVKCHYPKLTE